jgi:hypothetical protein
MLFEYNKSIHHRFFLLVLKIRDIFLFGCLTHEHTFTKQNNEIYSHPYMSFIEPFTVWWNMAHC